MIVHLIHAQTVHLVTDYQVAVTRASVQMVTQDLTVKLKLTIALVIYARMELLVIH